MCTEGAGPSVHKRALALAGLPDAVVSPALGFVGTLAPQR
jgi:hypothetical protein